MIFVLMECGQWIIGYPPPYLCTLIFKYFFCVTLSPRAWVGLMDCFQTTAYGKGNMMHKIFCIYITKDGDPSC